MNREISFRLWQNSEMNYYITRLDNFVEGVFMQFIGLFDIINKKIYEGDIVRWYSGCMFPHEDKKQEAYQSLENWKKQGRKGKYDWESNGWYKVYNIGIVIFYNGCFCIHNDLDIEDHKNNSKYNGTSYYGCFQSNIDYEIIGNIFENPVLVKLIKNQNK